MSALELVFYTARDNAEDLVLIGDDGSALDPASITRIKLISAGATLVDSDVYPAGFEWPVTKTTGPYKGSQAVRLKLGAAGLAAGRYVCHFVTYDHSNSNGLVWESTLILRIVTSV